MDYQPTWDFGLAFFDAVTLLLTKRYLLAGTRRSKTLFCHGLRDTIFNFQLPS